MEEGESGGDSGVTEKGRRILGQLVDIKAVAVVLAITMTVDEVLEMHRGHEDV